MKISVDDKRRLNHLLRLTEPNDIPLGRLSKEERRLIREYRACTDCVRRYIRLQTVEDIVWSIEMLHRLNKINAEEKTPGVVSRFRPKPKRS